MNNKSFYRTLDNHVYMNDPRGYISPYLDAELEGEIEHEVLMSKYMRLRNTTNHIFKNRLIFYSHG